MSDASISDVAVNLLWCVPGRVGGSEDYLVRQLLGLAEHQARHGVDFAPTLYCGPGFVAAHPDLAAVLPMVTGPVDGISRPRRVFVENQWLSRRTRRAALVHHGGGTAPTIGNRSIVLTIHDLQYLTYPEYVSATKLRYLRLAVPRSVERAGVVAVPSQYVRSTVIGAFHVDPQDVVIVPHGVEADLGASATAPDRLRGRYRLGEGPILVYPAITHPHKGHLFLLEMMASKRVDPELTLVLIGGAGAAEEQVRAAIVRLGLSRRVIRAGRVPSNDRDGLIAMAEALVFPSEYEGFGAPVVEAMALGTPVICSDQPALAEVVGGAGIVLPRDIDVWTGALADVAARRSELVAAGRRRVEHFSAVRSGAALAGAYRQVAER
jgi:glycosyltransferase involved in cell wall biosynthesis